MPSVYIEDEYTLFPTDNSVRLTEIHDKFTAFFRSSSLVCPLATTLPVWLNSSSLSTTYDSEKGQLQFDYKKMKLELRGKEFNKTHNTIYKVEHKTMSGSIAYLPVIIPIRVLVSAPPSFPSVPFNGELYIEPN